MAQGRTLRQHATPRQRGPHPLRLSSQLSVLTPAAAKKKDRLEAISLPTVTHALPTYGSCLATRCRFAPRADCGRTSCASTTAHMCILGLTHTLTDSCNPAKLSGRPLSGNTTLGGAAAQEPAHILTSGRVKSRAKLGAAPASIFRVRPSPHQSCHSPARSVFSRGRFFVGAKPPHGERTRPSASASGKSRAVKDPARCSRAVNMTLTAAPVANGQSWVRGFEAWVRKRKGSKGAAATRRRV